MDNQKIVRTFTNKGYLVRELQSEDARAYYNLINNNRQRLSTYFPSTVSENISIDTTKVHIAARLERMNRMEFLTYVIEDAKTKELIGSIFVKDIDRRVLRGELGFYLDENNQGKGIITESLLEVIQFCFNQLGLNKVFMRVALENTKSRKVAERLGFKTEGVIRQDFKTTSGEIIDVIYFGLLATEAKNKS